MTSLQHTPSNVKSLHLLRALLREATYLPDPNARTYFRSYIVNRFKAYQPTENATASASTNRGRTGFKTRHESVIRDRARTMQRKAQKGLNYLRRANLGEKPCLEKIMFFTYGRMGRRKYRLLDDLLKPDPAAAPEETNTSAGDKPSPLQAAYHSNKRYLQFFDAPKKVSDDHVSISISNHHPRLKAVVASQTQNRTSIGRELKSSNLKTPIRNAWERPMPVKRARNNVRRWYASTMSRLLPPLPNDEWDQLRALATGETKWTSAVVRRTPAIEQSPRPEDETARSKVLIEEGITFGKPSKADSPRGIQRPHNLTARTMQRLYARVFRLCCKLEWDEERSKWTAQWASLRDALPPAYSTPVDDALFAGVDGKGKLSTNTGVS